MYFKIEDNPAFIHYNSINLMVIGLSQHEHDKLVACSKSNEKDAFQIRSGLDEAPVGTFNSYDYER